MRLTALSSSTRLALLLFSAILLATFAVLGFLHIATQRSLAGQEVSLIGEVREDLLFSYRDGGPQGLAEAIQDRLATDPHTNAIMAYYAPGGEFIAGNLIPQPPDSEGLSKLTTLRRVGDPGVLPARFESLALPDGSQLVVGIVRTGVIALRSADRAGLILALVIAVPLALALAFILVSLIEHRARGIVAVAERVGAGELGSRIDVRGGNDAFGRLALALNAMFDRLETLVSELRTITDGLAHDLRSPVTRLLVAVEDARRVAENPNAVAALERASREANALNSVLTTALQITRAEAGIGRDRFETLELGGILQELAELYEPAAEEIGFRILVNAPRAVTISGHRQLIAQAIGNLIDNALHYASGGDRVELSADFSRDQAVIVTVADNGLGIPAEQRGEATRRFGRLDPARHESGSGLGLSLVAATAALHDGRLELDDAEPGLIVRVYLGNPIKPN